MKNTQFLNNLKMHFTDPITKPNVTTMLSFKTVQKFLFGAKIKSRNFPVYSKTAD